MPQKTGSINPTVMVVVWGGVKDESLKLQLFYKTPHLTSENETELLSLWRNQTLQISVGDSEVFPRPQRLREPLQMGYT